MAEDEAEEDNEVKMDILNMIPEEQFPFMLDQLEKLGRYDKNKGDQASREDKQFSSLMSNLLVGLKAAKITKERARSAPRATVNKPSNSAKRAHSARHPKATRINETAEEIPPRGAENPTTADADDEDTEKFIRQFGGKRHSETTDEELLEPQDRRRRSTRSESSAGPEYDAHREEARNMSEDHQNWHHQGNYANVNPDQRWQDPWHEGQWQEDPWRNWRAQERRDPWPQEA